MRIKLCFATCEWKGWSRCVSSWRVPYPHRCQIVSKKEIMHAYREMSEGPEEILAYIHDDVVCEEKNWGYRVLKEFEDEKVGIVGFGGALGHGDPMMYKKPYELPQLARREFLSNMKDAEIHGRRFTGECDVAVLDGFALVVRRSFLEEAGGWPVDTPVGYFMYAEWLCCMARLLGYRIRLVGIKCDHLGGKSTGLNPEAKFDFEGEHEYIYRQFKDVLPYHV